MSGLVALQSVSLRERAAAAIRTGIMTGEIRTGEIYSVPVIAAQLAVSATPVREAMLDLANEGLVVPVRNRGYRVVQLSAKELDDILQLRLLLEVPSTGQVALEHVEEDLPRFTKLAAQLPRLARSGDLQAYLEVDREFHVGLLELLGNQRLVDMVGMLRNQTRLLDVGSLAATGDLARAGAEHVEIIEAISQRDRRRTERLMTQHLRQLSKAWAGR